MQYWPPRLIAYAKIAADGTIRRSVGIASAANPVAGTYELNLSEPYQENGNLHCSITPTGDPAGATVATPLMYSVGEDAAPDTQLIVEFQDSAAAGTNTAFTVRVYRDN